MRFDAWPLARTVPIATAVIIFVVAVGTSQVAIRSHFAEQDRMLRQLAEVHLDGLSTAVQPYVLAGDVAGTTAALARAFIFQEGIVERWAAVRAEDGALFAAAPEGAPDQPAVAVGFRLDEGVGLATSARPLRVDGREVGRVEAVLDVSEIVERRRALQISVLLFDAGLSALAALLGFLAIRRLLAPQRLLTERLRHVETGRLDPVPTGDLPPPETEFGQLLRAYNAMVAALEERDRLTAELAEREKLATLGRLSAALAHEVRNPLGGLLTATDTLRRFGDDPQVRTGSIDLIERGLRSIGQVIDAALGTWRGDGRTFGPEDLDDVRRLVEPELRKRNLSLDWDVAADAGGPVGATEVRQILLNLLLNAAAAAKDGGRVGLRVAREDDGLRIVVSDDGPGLPTAAREAIASGAAPTGRGLGIWVIMRLVRNLGGRVDVDAATGRGTTVALLIPDTAPAGAEPAHA
ncbi:MAG: sensor histidine kinase [Rhodospirillales bacterium]